MAVAIWELLDSLFLVIHHLNGILAFLHVFIVLVLVNIIEFAHLFVLHDYYGWVRQ